jgi:hypothetical protein
MHKRGGIVLQGIARVQNNEGTIMMQSRKFIADAEARLLFPS